MGQSTFELNDRLLDGQLGEVLRELRSQGRTYDEIAAILRERDIHISRSTAHRWCRELGIHKPDRAA